MITNRNHESWTVPDRQKPPAAKLKRIGPETQFKPIRVKPETPKAIIHIPVKRFSEITPAERKKRQQKRRSQKTVWTPEMIDRCKKMLDEGLSATEIGERIGKKPENTAKMLRQAGIKHVNLIPVSQRKPTSIASKWTPEKVQMIREMCAKGMTVREIAEEFGYDRYPISAVIRYYNIPHTTAFKAQRAKGRWTKEEDARLLQMYKDGMRLKDIAAEMGKTVSSVSNRRIRLEKKLWYTSRWD